jgi:hypothetical protein
MRKGVTVLPLKDWGAVQRVFEKLPPPRVDFGPDGDLVQDVWIYRGLKSKKHKLEPSIERVAKDDTCFSWSAIEQRVLTDFQAKAPLVASVSLPPMSDKLSWLALMQHYGAPTRLLDFTYSPYLALYFALRSRGSQEIKSGAICIWAVDASALSSPAGRRHFMASFEEKKRRQRVSLAPADAENERESLESDERIVETVISSALAPSGIRRRFYNKNGFVCDALPRSQNLRLSNQQGLFLFNGAEDLSFVDSLFRMMKGRHDWCRVFEVPNEALHEIEKKPFQMNIHDLSVFPDMEGLAGFVRQKARLHWAPRRP